MPRFPLNLALAPLLSLSATLFPTPPIAGAAELVDLRCDYRSNPLAVDRGDPMLSWRLEGTRDGLAQTAYQIQATTGAGNTGQEPTRAAWETPTLWDSGWVDSDQLHAIAYAGKPPAAKQRVHWRVRIKDESGDVLPWSIPARFDAGLLTDGDWMGAKWIACDRQLQNEYGPDEVMGDWIATDPSGDVDAATITYKLNFTLPEKLVVYAGTWWSHVDKGSIAVKFNGRKGLGGTEGPPTIHYNDLGFYVNSQRGNNENEFTITLTDSDASTPVSLGMQIVFADGSEQIIGTSDDWRVTIVDRSASAKVICQPGQSPLGRVKISPRAPLAAAWYKQDFNVTKDVAAARLYVCGLGYHEPYLNGTKIGDHVLDPGQADYEEFAHYQVFDVRDHVKSGANALSILLGDGWQNNDRWFSHDKFLYGKPGLRAYLDIRYADGTSDHVVTNRDWNWKPSGLTMSNVFLGDYLDYRLWDSQWEEPGTPDGWKPVKEVKPLSPQLVAQDFPPIRVVREIDPVKTWQIGEKTWVVDLGQNISGWIALNFHEPSGTVLRMRCVEMLQENGEHLENVPGSFWSCHASPQHHRIIADGKPHQWRPFFSYHGFRFAEIHGLSQPPTPGQIKGLVVHTDTPVIAQFESSEPMLDRIFQMGIQSHLNNMHSVLEDCPHREKCLWGGDFHSSWATGLYTLDSASFYRQQVRLFLTPPFDPLGIPGRIGVGRRSTRKTLDFTWSVSPLFVAWQNYQVNGDLQSAADHYDVLRQFLRYFENNSPDLLPHIHRYGDHAPPLGIPRTPADSQLIASLNFYAAANRFADFAEGLGKSDDAAWSRDLAERIRESIFKKYYNEQNHTFGNGTHDSLALAFGIVDPSERTAVAASLAKIYQDNGKKFDGGFMSYHIYPQLTLHGHVDLAMEMLLNPDYPGIAQSIRDHDATTIFEKFRTDSRAKQLHSSLDHHAMNHPTAWMLNDLAGIRVHPDHPGGRTLLLAPRIPKSLKRVKASVDLNYGTVESGWSNEDGRVKWSVTVPPNTSAIVSLDNPRELSVDGKPTANGTENASGELTLNAGRHELQWSVAR